MELSTKYNPGNVEDKWYENWLKYKYFHSEPDDREPYTIVIPPPNVTGVLHMGHMLNNTIQDVLVRYHRMNGKNACWVPGTDHASIATEAKVVAYLKQQGIDKNELTREEFLKHAWAWKEKHGGIILEQLKKLGASCDWDRTKFTMDEDLSRSVIHVFVDLFRKGKIYRGIRMINWDPQAQTALSDEEVIYKEVKGKLYYVKYKVEGEDDYIVIATTRPETILGDTAVCVNPNDERFTKYVGKKVIVPIVNRSVPVIADEYVDMEFGTGALKITPAHDINDYELGLKYNLEVIDIFNDDGTLNEKATYFVGKDRFESRDLVVEKLKEDGLLVKEEDYVHSVGFSERTDVVIEPKISTQWFLNMKELAKPALENVLNGNIKFHPAKFVNTYRHWMENIKDWCISRQLWWGHRIPAWYLPDGSYVVAHDEKEAYELAKEKNPAIKPEDLRQDEDVLDTWFSSWLWPLSVFNGILEPENKDFKYYYPTDDLVTAPEILFFWVARMIMAGYEYAGEKPFKNVYLTGIVRDKLRRKMSKSLGNSPDPLDLIAKYGADGVRVGMLFCSPAGNDLLFDESLTEQGRNFANKIWNAFRLVKSWQVDESANQPSYAAEAVKWFAEKLKEQAALISSNIEKYRISDALMNIYTLFRDDFASWHLEIIKPGADKKIDSDTYKATISFFEDLMKLLHPFMPFISEEVWHLLGGRGEDETIMFEQYPKGESYDESIISGFEEAKQIVMNVRNFRKENNIPNKQALNLHFDEKGNYSGRFTNAISKLANLEEFTPVASKPGNSVSFMVGVNTFYIETGEGVVDVEKQINKLKEELEYYEGFLKSVMKKLSNEKFVNNAPKPVVEKEMKKKLDAETKIESIKQQLEQLGVKI